MLRILAVDDTPALLRVVERTLVNQGHQVFVATTGREAIAAARESVFDVAVVDYEIPPPNGIEVLAALRRLRPACVSILASGALDVPAVTGAVNRGDIAWVLNKPFAPDELVAAVHEALSSRRRIGETWAAENEVSRRSEREAFDECMAQDMLRLALQPIVTAKHATVVAYEALLRSRHPVLQGPIEVIDAAERHDQVRRLGARVAEMAAVHLAGLRDSMRLFVNLHPAELSDPVGLPQRMQPLAPYAHRVVVEITERSRIEDGRAFHRSVAALRNMGFAIAVDDLGAGYSSLAALAYLEPSVIKVDMSLVRGLDSDARKRRLVQLVCHFGQATGAKVVAEGIESAAEGTAARECGCDWLQGYLYGRPS